MTDRIKQHYDFKAMPCRYGGGIEDTVAPEACEWRRREPLKGLPALPTITRRDWMAFVQRCEAPELRRAAITQGWRTVGSESTSSSWLAYVRLVEIVTAASVARLYVEVSNSAPRFVEGERVLLRLGHDHVAETAIWAGYGTVIGERVVGAEGKSSRTTCIAVDFSEDA